MRASKALAAAGLAALAAPATACDLEAFGEQRFSAFGGTHTGGQQASDPAPPRQQPEPQQGGGTDSPSGEGQSSGGGDAPTEDASGAAEPASGSDGQGDAATFR